LQYNLKQTDMKNLTISDKIYHINSRGHFINARDLGAAFEYITKFVSTRKDADTVYISAWEEEYCKDNYSMTTIKVTFQIWKKNESGTGRKFEWVNYRGKSFGCSNQRIDRVLCLVS
jgi:hypothetical protein